LFLSASFYPHFKIIFEKSSFIKSSKYQMRAIFFGWLPTEWGALEDTTSTQDEGDRMSSSATSVTTDSSHRGPITMVAAAPSLSGSAATVGVDGRLCIWQIPERIGLPAPSSRTIDVGAILNLECMTRTTFDGNNEINEFPTEPITVMLHSVSWSATGDYVAVCGEHGKEGDGLLRLWRTSASASGSATAASAANNRPKRSTSFFSRSSTTKQSTSTQLKMASRVAVLMGRKKNTAAEDEQARVIDTSDAGAGNGSQQESLLGNKTESADWWAVPPTVLEGQVTGQNGTFYCVAFDPAGTMLASGGAASGPTASKRGASGQVILWQVVAGGDGWKQMVVLGHGDKNGNNVLPSAVRALAFGPTGRRIATSSGREGAASVGDNVVRVWDVVQKRVALTIPLEAEAGGAVGLDFAPSGRGLAVACANGDVRVYATDMHDRDSKSGTDVADSSGDNATLVKFLSGSSAPPRSQGSVLLRFTGAHVGGATGVKFGPNGAYLFSIGLDGCVRAWSIASAAPAAAFPMRAAAGVGGGMGPISIAPDGYGVVAGDASGAPYMLQLQVARADTEQE
jgi:WD40 repeat protein